MAFVSGVAVAASPGCGSSSSTFGTTAGIGDDAGDATVAPPDFRDGGQLPGTCVGLECNIVSCGAAPPTTVSGTVFAPNGTLPLYNVVVYVPNAPLDPIPEGPSCDRCGNVSGSPVVSTLTDTSGKFVLKNVPVGANIPLVIQVGKWRRQITLPAVEKCVDNPLTDANLTRLPKNKADGHIPKIAVTTGVCDPLACLLPKLGLDAAEYSAVGGAGRLNLFQGAGDTCNTDAGVTCTGKAAPAPTGTQPATNLWKDVDSLKKYDMVVMSCECDEHNEQKPDASKAALYDYLKLGGRVFASHYHYTWFQNSPVGALKNVAEWVGLPSPAQYGGAGFDGVQPPFVVDQSFPKGQALAQWLVNVDASKTLGEVPLNQPKSDVLGVNASLGTRWIHNKFVLPGGVTTPESTKYLSFNAPVGEPADKQCGKAVFGDMHISEAKPGLPGTTLPDNGFPGSCPTELTAAEKALVFLFFDLASCVQEEKLPPSPPK